MEAKIGRAAKVKGKRCAMMMTQGEGDIHEDEELGKRSNDDPGSLVCPE
jgi:hypothetical protein